MERLTKRGRYKADIIGVDSFKFVMGLGQTLGHKEIKKVTDAVNRLAGYEDLEEQGKLLELTELPAAIGDKYRDIFIFVPEMRQLIRIAEGNGSNLLAEDIDNGYVDYIYYDQYELGEDITEVDGGQILLKEPFRNKYCCMTECIPDVLDMAYGGPAGYIILA